MRSPLSDPGFSSLGQPLNAWLDHVRVLPIVVSGHSPLGSPHVTESTQHDLDLRAVELGGDKLR
jgi:hypothetical protein